MRRTHLITAVVSLMLFSAAAAVSGQQENVPFYRPGRPAAGIPSPEKTLGFRLGEKPVRYRDIQRYAEALAEASPRVTIEKTGSSVEGRDLFILIVSAEDNIGNLQSIKETHRRLGDPRITPPAEAEKIIRSAPAVAWMMYNVHGGELSGSDAALALAYRLAAGSDEDTNSLLAKTVVIIDPTQNPDGRERGLAQLEQWSGRVSGSDTRSLTHRGTWPGSRANHYLFDMNRDWFILSQQETRARVAAILSWNPQLVVDAHEMGSSSTYFFNPPREPVNPHIHPAIHRWWDVFSKDQASAFDAHGWSYYTKDSFDEWYPGYGSSWPYFLGAIAILYEQAGTGGTRVMRPEHKEMTFSEAVHHQYVSSLANIRTAAANRKELLSDFYQIRSDACRLPAKDNPQAYFLFPGKDTTRIELMLSRLMAQGIEIEVTLEETRATGLTYWQPEELTVKIPRGSWMIRMDQPLSPLVTALLSFDMRLNNRQLAEERTSLEKGDGTKMYEIGAWNTAMAYGVDAFAARKLPGVTTSPLRSIDPRPGTVINASPGYGYIFSYADSRAMNALADCFAAGLKVRSASKPFMTGGRSFDRGALLLRNHENPAGLPELITQIALRHGITVFGVHTALTDKGPDLGGGKFILLQEPKIALVTGPGVSSTGFGSIWYLLDTGLGIRHSLLDLSTLGRTDLRPYNVLIFPSSGAYKNSLGSEGLNALKTWIRNGGTCIGLDRTASFLADSSTGLSAVRERSKVLKDLHLYQQAFRDEQRAGTTSLDSLSIWGNTAGPDTAPPALKDKKDIKSLTYEDNRWKTFYPRGAILRINVKKDHWLGFGAGDRVPALIYTGSAYLAKSPVETAARFADSGSLRLSGLLWPEARERWANTVYAARQQQGSGQVILFSGDPFYRGYFYSTARLFLNSVLLGPGFGTRQPMPL